MLKAVYFMIAVVVLLLLLVGGFLAYIGWGLRPQPPDSALPPIARDLPRKFTDGDRVFQDRVRRRFQPGIQETQLVKQLAAEGFHVHGQAADFQQSAFPCLLGWEISWLIDPANRRVVSIKSSYGERGCL